MLVLDLFLLQLQNSRGVLDGHVADLLNHIRNPDSDEDVLQRLRLRANDINAIVGLSEHHSSKRVILDALTVRLNSTLANHILSFLVHEVETWFRYQRYVNIIWVSEQWKSQIHKNAVGMSLKQWIYSDKLTGPIHSKLKKCNLFFMKKQSPKAIVNLEKLNNAVNIQYSYYFVVRDTGDIALVNFVRFRYRGKGGIIGQSINIEDSKISRVFELVKSRIDWDSKKGRKNSRLHRAIPFTSRIVLNHNRRKKHEGSM